MSKNDKWPDIWPVALRLAEKVYVEMKVKRDWEKAFSSVQKDEQTLLEELYKQQTFISKAANYVEKGDECFFTKYGKKKISEFLTVRYRYFYESLKLDNPYSTVLEPYNETPGFIIFP